MLGFAPIAPPILVMELCQSGSLFDHLYTRHHVFPMRDMVSISTGIAAGLQHLHAHNVVHRDLKSSNVLLDEHFEAKVSDFGLAKIRTVIQQTSSTMHMVGTLLWLAPESTAARPRYTDKSDMYSFALVLSELIHNETPYSRLDIQNQVGLREEIYEIGTRPLVPQPSARLPADFLNVMRQCWHPDPARRLSAAEAHLRLSAIRLN